MTFPTVNDVSRCRFLGTLARRPACREIGTLLPALTFAGGLAGLAANDFTLVTDPLALVRLDRAELANVGGYRADLFLVDAFDPQAGREPFVRGRRGKGLDRAEGNPGR